MMTIDEMIAQQNKIIADANRKIEELVMENLAKKVTLGATYESGACGFIVIPYSFFIGETKNLVKAFRVIVEGHELSIESFDYEINTFIQLNRKKDTDGIASIHYEVSKFIARHRK